VALMSNSVKGLTRENVSVLDADTSFELSERRDARGMVNSDQLSHQRDVESNLAEKAQAILAPLIHNGRAVVRVTADMTFRRVTETSEKFDPDGKVVTHETATTLKSSTPLGPKGPAGTPTNIPPSGGGAQNGNNASQNEEMTENEYVVSRVNHQHEEQLEQINRLTVAVMLVPENAEPDKAPEESLGISLAEAEKLVKQAVGFKTGRDEIQVSIGRMTDSPVDTKVDQEVLLMQQWSNYTSMVRAGSLGIASITALAIAFLALRGKKVPAPTGPQGQSGNSPEELQDLQAVAATVRAWLEESPTIKMNQSGSEVSPKSKPA